MDVSTEELFDVVDAAVRDLLARAGVVEPPVDALWIAQRIFGMSIVYSEPDDGLPPQYGDPPKRRPGPNSIVLREEQSSEAQHGLAAKAIGKRLLPVIFPKLGIADGTENPSSRNALVALVVPRLLLPTRWFGPDARKSGYDLLEMKERYSSVGFELIAHRFLDVDDEPCVIAIVDDNSVVSRRGNRFQATRTLTPAERLCSEQVEETNDPARVRKDDWTAWGWPTVGIPFRRIILRAVPDEI